MLYGTLKEQENKLDMIMRNLESQSVNTGFVPQQATLSNPPVATNVSQQNTPNYGSWSTDVMISPVGNVQDVVRQHSVADVKVVDFLRINFQK